MRIDAVLFDVGGTLILPRESVGKTYAQIARQEGFGTLDEQRIDQQFQAAWQSKGDFHYRQEDWLRVVTQAFEGELEAKAIRELFPSLYRRFEHASAWKIHQDTLPTLDMLADRGFRLGIISNWDQRLKPLLSSLRLDVFFEWVGVSCEVGFEKPSPVIFEHAIAKLGIPPERILFVGDQPSEDFEGARQVGMRSLLIDRDKPSDLHSLSDLRELENRIAEAWL